VQRGFGDFGSERIGDAVIVKLRGGCASIAIAFIP